MVPPKNRLQILGRIVTRNERGYHFPELYEDVDIAALEKAGLIQIDRPVHQPTGIPYSCEHWTVEVTQLGQEYIEAYL
jgi:hypothetical protein